jgi:hypothetical protein
MKYYFVRILNSTLDAPVFSHWFYKVNKRCIKLIYNNGKEFVQRNITKSIKPPRSINEIRKAINQDSYMLGYEYKIIEITRKEYSKLLLLDEL